MPGFLKRLRARRGRVGLALGSGSARGWAHIGVIRALEEADIEIDLVAGTSIGSLVGAAYASGRIDSLETVVRELDWRRAMALFDLSLPRSGLLDGRRVTAAIREQVESGDIEDLQLPYCAVSTDLTDGSEVRIREGDLIEAIRASISIPGIFTPVRRGERLLVDGGLVDPVPTAAAREMGASFVISVDINHGAAGIGVRGDGGGRAKSRGGEVVDRLRAEESRLTAQLTAIGKNLGLPDLPKLMGVREWFDRRSLPGILEVVISSLNIMEKQITEMQLVTSPPDLLVRPKLADIDPMDFHRGEESIAEGYRAARERLESAGLWSADQKASA